MQNPFKPTAGAAPPDLIGRAGLLDDFAYGLRIGSGAPGLLTIITGARGIGKTVMLGAAETLAREQGWAVISQTANPGFLAKIQDKMIDLTDELGDGPRGRRITAFSAAGFGLTTQIPAMREPSWRDTGAGLLKILDERGTGLVITVDEIHAGGKAEISQLAADVQHFIREGLPIGLVFAGLPAAVSDLLNEGVATFLRRADRIDLHGAAINDVQASYREIFASAGLRLHPDWIREAAEKTEGYPFLIQLVGYFLWMEAQQLGSEIDIESVRRAIRAASRRNTRVVVEAALADISNKDAEFLRAMSLDNGPSTAADIGHRLKAKANLVSKYRKRLIAAGLIEAAGYGKVGFAIPGLRDHLRASEGRP